MLNESTASDAALDTYLHGVAQRGGVLGRLLSHPDPYRGVQYTPREIAQQPYLWRHAARMMKEQAASLKAFLERAGMYEPTCRPHIVLTGAGTSDYVGVSVSDLLRKHFDTPCYNWPTTRVAAAPDIFLTKGFQCLMLHFARSGNSPESKAVLDLGLGCCPDTIRHIVITCNGEGELASMAREHPDRVYLVVLHEASNDHALAMTSSFSTMAVVAQALAHLDDMEEFIGLYERVAQAAEYLIAAYSDTIYDLADPSLHRAFYLGNADLLGAAVESALKVQELTVGQVIAKGEDTLAFRHGPISAVNGNTLLCFFLSADAYTRRYEKDVLLQYQRDFLRMGVRTVVVLDRHITDGYADGIVRIAYDPDNRWLIPTYYQVNVAVLFGQLFGMFSSYRRGLNVDDPPVENALYSRTVQGVRIYEYTDSI